MFKSILPEMNIAFSGMYTYMYIQQKLRQWRRYWNCSQNQVKKTKTQLTNFKGRTSTGTKESKSDSIEQQVQRPNKQEKEKERETDKQTHKSKRDIAYCHPGSMFRS